MRYLHAVLKLNGRGTALTCVRLILQMSRFGFLLRVSSVLFTSRFRFFPGVFGTRSVPCHSSSAFAYAVGRCGERQVRSVYGPEHWTEDARPSVVPQIEALSVRL